MRINNAGVAQLVKSASLSRKRSWVQIPSLAQSEKDPDRGLFLLSNYANISAMIKT